MEYNVLFNDIFMDKTKKNVFIQYFSYFKKNSLKEQCQSFYFIGHLVCTVDKGIFAIWIRTEGRQKKCRVLDFHGESKIGTSLEVVDNQIN